MYLRKLGSEVEEPGHKSGTPIWEASTPRNILTTVPNLSAHAPYVVRAKNEIRKRVFNHDLVKVKERKENVKAKVKRKNHDKTLLFKDFLTCLILKQLYKNV